MLLEPLTTKRESLRHQFVVLEFEVTIIFIVSDLLTSDSDLLKKIHQINWNIPIKKIETGITEELITEHGSLAAC